MGDCKKVQFCIQAPVGMEGTVPYLCTYRLFIFLSVELKKSTRVHAIFVHRVVV